MEKLEGVVRILTLCGSLGFEMTPVNLVRMTDSTADVLWVVTRVALRHPSRALFVNACRTIVSRANSNTPKTRASATGAHNANSTAAVARRRLLLLFVRARRDMSVPICGSSWWQLLHPGDAVAVYREKNPRSHMIV